ncbi:MAG TPA: DUF1810 domain-containing protein [Humibacillus sp.]|nr:DUF1810 domain-containing protein [Humibacillus sp.]
MTDPFDLERFVRAQNTSGTYGQALAELRAGLKQGHWMWFVFPQVAGLGRSATAQRYAVSGLPEARAFLAHPVLGPRLRECAEVMDGLDETDPRQVLGGIDAVKLRSSMTLFERAAGDDPETAGPFGRVLDHYFGGRRDDATLGILGGVERS